MLLAAATNELQYEEQKDRLAFKIALRMGKENIKKIMKLIKDNEKKMQQPKTQLQ